jgi:hypothetical protein
MLSTVTVVVVVLVPLGEVGEDESVLHAVTSAVRRRTALRAATRDARIVLPTKPVLFCNDDRSCLLSACAPRRANGRPGRRLGW